MLLSSAPPCTKAHSRTKKRLLEIKDHLQNLDTINYAEKRLREPSIRDDITTRNVIEKMISLHLIDDYTSPIVFDCLVENLPAMSIMIGRCARGNGLDLVSTCLKEINTATGSAHKSISSEEGGKTIAQVFELARTNYTTAMKQPEEKCIFWTFSIAFFLLYFKLMTGGDFILPGPVSDKDLTEFFLKYPEFLIRSWDAADLLQFRMVMKHIVSMYGNGNNKACLVEMVTRITRGREIALTCNTSGGAMKKETIYNDETEVAAECCRVRIYQRESGVEPRRRDHSNDEKQGIPAKIKPAPAPKVAFAELKRVPTSDIKMIAGLKDAFEHDSLPADVVTSARPPTKRFKSAPEPKTNIVNIDMPKPSLERRHSSGKSITSTGIESILAAAGSEDIAFDMLDIGRPDMSRTISEDIANSMKSALQPSIGNTLSLNLGDDIGSLLYPPCSKLTRVLSNASTISTESFGLSRISSAGTDCYTESNTPDKTSRRPPKCSRVTSQDWAQYPYST